MGCAALLRSMAVEGTEEHVLRERAVQAAAQRRPQMPGRRRTVGSRRPPLPLSMPPESVSDCCYFCLIPLPHLAAIRQPFCPSSRASFKRHRMSGEKTVPLIRLASALAAVHLIGGREAMYDGSNCDKRLRSPITESEALTAAILPVSSAVNTAHGSKQDESNRGKGGIRCMNS